MTVEGPGDTASFEYAPEFIASGIRVAPLMMPPRPGIFRFPALPHSTFLGLPGMLADALPDRFGSALIAQWLAEQGRSSEDFDAVERLCYVGARAMGALEFEPALGRGEHTAVPLDVAALVDLAARVLAERSGAGGRLGGGRDAAVLSDILRVGTSAGGARAKAVVAWNPTTGELRSGQGAIPPGFEAWLLKFDGVASSGDRGLADPAGYGVLEYAYALMARAARIMMMPSRLLEEGGRTHFMTRRFDRTATGGKVHMQSLGALAHFDYNDPRVHSYEDALMVCQRLGLDIASREELFRRMVFNVIARNQDDHVKNIAFLMNRSGEWMLAPAFDVVYSWNPEGGWTHQHQMSVNGKREGFTRSDVLAVAASAALQASRARDIVREVEAAVREWPRCAAEAGVDELTTVRVGKAHRRLT